MKNKNKKKYIKLNIKYVNYNVSFKKNFRKSKKKWE